MTLSFVILASHSHSDSEFIGNYYNLGIVGGGILCVRMQKRFFKVVAIYQFKALFIYDSQDYFHSSVNEYTYREHNDLGFDVKVKGRILSRVMMKIMKRRSREKKSFEKIKSFLCINICSSRRKGKRRNGYG